MAQVSHIGLTVKNLERSMAFYGDVAGMSPGAVLQAEDRDANPGRVRMKMVHMIAGAFVLQLIEYVTGGGITLHHQQNNVGGVHISFYVPDVDAKFAEVQARGDVKITSQPTQMGPSLRGFYTEDPDGVPVEFVQTTK
jgi:predicted enzyme related to lactoylglutathione lyase